MKPPHMIALGVIVVCMIVMLFSFSGAIAQHVTIRQAMAHPNEVVQVPGNIVKDTVVYDTQRGELRFDILGVDPGTRKVVPTERLTIVYAQPKPENFDSAFAVEAVGKYEGGVFRAQNLLVKCPSKYSDDKPAQVAGK